MDLEKAIQFITKMNLVGNDWVHFECGPGTYFSEYTVSYDPTTGHGYMYEPYVRIVTCKVNNRACFDVDILGMPVTLPAIEIVNMRNESIRMVCDFAVDRSTPLGNPFPMKGKSDESRNDVCDKYRVWFHEEMERLAYHDPNRLDPMSKMIDEMISACRNEKRLRLFCWCAPKRCHAETIRDYLIHNVRTWTE